MLLCLDAAMGGGGGGGAAVAGGSNGANGGGAQQVSVLTFTNPNYSPSAPDVVVPEKKTFSWQRWKYDRSQERVYDMQVRIISLLLLLPPTANSLNKNWCIFLHQDEKQSQTEAASLIPHSLPLPEVEIDLEAEADGASSGPSATPPPTPPQRMDSICLT